MNTIAKRIYNIAPDPVELTLDDGTTHTYRLRSAEFFQEDFQAEAERDDEHGVDYRLATTENRDAVILGRNGPEDRGWQLVGTVEAATRA